LILKQTLTYLLESTHLYKKQGVGPPGYGLTQPSVDLALRSSAFYRGRSEAGPAIITPASSPASPSEARFPWRIGFDGFRWDVGPNLSLRLTVLQRLDAAHRPLPQVRLVGPLSNRILEKKTGPAGSPALPAMPPTSVALHPAGRRGLGDHQPPQKKSSRVSRGRDTDGHFCQMLGLVPGREAFRLRQHRISRRLDRPWRHVQRGSG